MLLFTKGPGLSLTAVHLPRDKNAPVLIHTSPQLLPKPLPAVMLHRLHYSVNALHKERGEELFWQGQQQRHQVLVHICLVPWATSLCHVPSVQMMTPAFCYSYFKQGCGGFSDIPPLPQH